MHVYGNGAWIAGLLDATPGVGEVRISVHRQVAIAPADEQFFVRRAQAGMVVSYLRMLGPRRVVRKVISRRGEATRNDAWLTIGIGTDEGGAPVGFVTTTGARAAERVVVADELCFAVDEDALGRPAAHLHPRQGAEPWRAVGEVLATALGPLVGWRRESGEPVALATPAQQALVALVLDPPAGGYVALESPPAPSPVRERVGGAVPPGAASRPQFTLFGYGQYAKTQVIPNLGEQLELACVHEIDPLQLGPVEEGAAVAWDTAPRPRPDEAIEHAAVAGYHHTHAPLAAELIERGARHVVLEKPVASSLDELEELLGALDRHPEARVHVAFQRRYSAFNPLLVRDLGGGPISMAATVYEVPLPARHWYRWPVVGNAVVSNGCHWIDHFLYLNGYAGVTQLHAERLSTQVVLGLELANGASGLISLRHEGAPRRGVRDRCTFWHDDASATIDDLRRYSAEQGFRRLRPRSAHPYAALEAMYREFGRRITADLPGDPPEQIRATAAVTLELACLVDREP